MIILLAGASGALLEYIEKEQKVTFVSGGLSIEKISLENYMSISSSNAAALELINPMPNGSSVHQRKALTLFRWLNQTKTKAGAR